MARIVGIGNAIVRRDKEETPQTGGWLTAPLVRERKGIMSSVGSGGGSFSPSTTERPDRFLTEEELWRVYRRTPDVRAAIDSIVRRVATFDWKIQPTVDPSDPRYERAVAISSSASRFLSAPNENGDTWQELSTSYLTDLLVHDAAAIEPVMNAGGDLAELVAIRGPSITPVVDEYGRIERYDQDADGSVSASFPTDQLIYLRMFANTVSPFGMPLIEALVSEVITLLRSSEHLMNAFDADEIPSGILVLSGIAGNAAREARADLQQMRGQDHKIRVLTTADPTGAGAKWVELKKTPKDLEMKDLVQEIRKTVWRVFGVMPVEMGATDGVNRATAQVQMDVSASHLVTPILELIQSKINSRVLPLVIGDAEEFDLVEFVFDREAKPTADEEQKRSSTLNNYVQQGVMTRNEVRDRLGLLPVEGGDIPTVQTGQGPVPLASFLGSIVDDLDSDSDPDDPDDSGGSDSGSDPDPDEGIDAPVETVDSDVAGEVVSEKSASPDVLSVRAVYDDIDFSPPKGVRAECQRGLDWKAEGFAGSGDSAIRWARKLAQGKDITPDKARRMKSYLARHEVDKGGKGFDPDDDGYPSKGRVAWAIWGGDPAVSWCNKIVRQMDAADDRSKGCCDVRDVDDDLPSEWQPNGRFRGKRTVNLVALGETIIKYKRSVVPFWEEARSEVVSIVTNAYKGGMINSDESGLAVDSVSRAMDKLALKWRMATEPLYLEATKIGRAAAVDFTGQEVLEDWAFRSDRYTSDAMGYLTESTGLIGEVKLRVVAMIAAVTRDGAVPTDLRSDTFTVPPDVGIGAEEVVIASAVDSVFISQAHRVTNWSGKLVELANRSMTDGVVEGRTAAGSARAVEWWYEWVHVSDNRTCPTCSLEGGSGYRRVSNMTVEPAGATECGARCRCVVVLWTGDEINKGDAVSLAPSS